MRTNAPSIIVSLDTLQTLVSRVESFFSTCRIVLLAKLKTYRKIQWMLRLSSLQPLPCCDWLLLVSGPAFALSFSRRISQHPSAGALSLPFVITTALPFAQTVNREQNFHSTTDWQVLFDSISFLKQESLSPKYINEKREKKTKSTSNNPACAMSSTVCLSTTQKGLVGLTSLTVYGIIHTSDIAGQKTVELALHMA